MSSTETQGRGDGVAGTTRRQREQGVRPQTYSYYCGKCFITEVFSTTQATEVCRWNHRSIEEFPVERWYQQPLEEVEREIEEVRIRLQNQLQQRHQQEQKEIQELVQNLALAKPKLTAEAKRAMLRLPSTQAERVRKLNFIIQKLRYDQYRQQRYHCFRCNRVVSPTVQGVCPTCNSSLVTNADYYHGPNLDQLAERLSTINMSGTHKGPTPAAKSAVEALLNVEFTREVMAREKHIFCAVCQEKFELGLDTKKMPCSHIYHPDCLLQWLASHNSCPVCRFELPTDDSEYEHKKERAQESST